MKKLALVTIFGICLVLLITWLSGGFTDYVKPPDKKPINLAEDESPEAWDGSTSHDPRGASPGVLDSSQDGKWFVVDKSTGLLKQEFSWARLTPRENNWADVEKPVAKLFLSDQRIMVIRAETGSIHAPNNEPQLGSFGKQLVLTLYKNPTGGRINISENSPHRIMTFHLPEGADFDASLGRISSTGPVEGVSDRLAFSGTGLQLNFNEVKRRLEYLEITRGKQLKISSPSAEQSPASSEADPDRPPASDSQTSPADPPQYYQLVFQDDVVVTSGGNIINADRMTSLFTMVADQVNRDRTTLGMAPVAWIRPGRLLNPAPWILAFDPASSKPAPTPSNLFDTDEPLEITWSGSMVMRPLEAKPEALVDATDRFVRFDGVPVTVRGDAGLDVRCGIVTYSEAQRRLIAAGTEQARLVMNMPDSGTIAGLGDDDAGQLILVADLARQRAQLRGPGYMRQAPAAPKADPTTSQISWQETADLIFAQSDTDPANPREQRIEAANFAGKVQVRDPRLTMNADRVNARFANTGSDAATGLEELNAIGAVEVMTDNGQIRAGELDLLTRIGPENRRIADRLIARRDVVAELTEPYQKIAAQTLHVTLADTDTALAERDDPESGAFAGRVSKLDASGGVTIQFGRDTEARYAESVTLTADAIAGRATLKGDPARPVILRNADTRLTVPIMNITDNGERAETSGSGTFAYRQGEPDERGHRRRVNVSWTDSMRFDQKKNIIDVRGSVNAEAEDAPNEQNHITADQLLLELVDESALNAEVEGKPVVADEASEKKLTLRRMWAVGNTRLRAVRWENDEKEKITTRMLLTGPNFEYLTSTQTARVQGAGMMLIEDYRAGNGEKPEAGTPASSMMPSSGRGRTLFSWRERMTFDGEGSLILLAGRVQMTHVPLGGGERDQLELAADRLTADFVQPGDKSTMELEGFEGDMKINKIQALGNVTMQDLKSRREITTHQMDFDGTKETVLLTASKERPVEIIDYQQNPPRPLLAEQILWNLSDNAIRILKARR